jgi:hypothetical protein
VKEKAGRALPAKDLYRSTLFDGRRAFVERTCDDWWILSAEYGLVSPEEVLAPYEMSLKSLGRPARREWAAKVLDSIELRVKPAPRDVFEIHAGAECRDFGLLDGLVARGCAIENPTEGMRIGNQLQFYKRAAAQRT